MCLRIRGRCNFWAAGLVADEARGQQVGGAGIVIEGRVGEESGDLRY